MSGAATTHGGARHEHHFHPPETIGQRNKGNVVWLEYSFSTSVRKSLAPTPDGFSG